MRPLIVTLIFSFVIPIYFLRLMADARKLRTRLRCARLAPAGEIQEGEELFTTSDYAVWTGPPFGNVKAASGGRDGRSYAPDAERPGAE